MIAAIADAVGPVLQFAVLRPGLFLMLVGMAVIGVKLWRTGSKRTKYHIKDFWKYPDDAVLTGGAALMFLVGLFRFLFM